MLVLGSGSVSRCLQPLLLQHLDADFSRAAVMDFAEVEAPLTEAGAALVRAEVTPENYARLLGEHLGEGDLLVNLSWNVETEDVIGWCHDHGVLYVDTSVEVWDPYSGRDDSRPEEQTLHHRHVRLRKLAAGWSSPGPTAVVEHGANPGLVSHWVKRALLEIGERMGIEETTDFARLAMLTGTKVIQIAERDTQISSWPKEPGEFVNTWSVEGFFEEGTAPAELGWGTHERRIPPLGRLCDPEAGHPLCLARAGIDTHVRSWVPLGGPIVGMLVRHGEAVSIGDHLTVPGQYRPTVFYAYQPADAAIASFHEVRGNGYRLQERWRIMDDDIVSGIDELGVLLLGHGLNGWWTGSQLGIDEARALVPGQNATTLQVAASVLGCLAWMVDNPERGLCVPDDLDHEHVLAVAGPYLGPCPSVQTDWTPLAGRETEPFAPEPPAPEDVWQFETFLA